MKAIETALSLTQAYKLGIERFEKMLGDEFAKAIDSMNNTSTHIIAVSYTHLPSPRDRTRSRMPSSA